MGYEDYERHSPDGGIWTRVTNAVSGGGIFRTLLRFVALVGALIILGLNKVQCSLNYVGNNNLTGWENFILFYDAIVYGYQRASILLWSQLGNLNSDALSNWGDITIVLVFVFFVFIALYSLVSIIADLIDGSPTDTAPTYLKVIITIGLLLIFSSVSYYTAEKPEGEYFINTNIILTQQESQICKQSGELGYFTSVSAINDTIIKQPIKINNTINNTMQNTIIGNSNTTIYNNTINQSKEQDKSVQLINMLNN